MLLKSVLFLITKSFLVLLLLSFLCTCIFKMLLIKNDRIITLIKNGHLFADYMFDCVWHVRVLWKLWMCPVFYNCSTLVLFSSDAIRVSCLCQSILCKPRLLPRVVHVSTVALLLVSARFLFLLVLLILKYFSGFFFW